MAKPLAKNRMIVYYNDGGGHGGIPWFRLQSSGFKG
jgi:hypothetical protein